MPYFVGHSKPAPFQSLLLCNNDSAFDSVDESRSFEIRGSVVGWYFLRLFKPQAQHFAN